MKTNANKAKEQKIEVEAGRSKYACKSLHSDKEKAAKRFEGTAMEILKQFGKGK